MSILESTLDLKDGTCTYQLAKIRLKLGEILKEDLEDPSYERLLSEKSGKEKAVKNENGNLTRFTILHALLNIPGIVKNKASRTTYPVLNPVFDAPNLYSKGTSGALHKAEFAPHLDNLITIVNTHLKEQGYSFFVPHNIFGKSFISVPSLYKFIEANINTAKPNKIIEIAEQGAALQNPVDAQMNLMVGVDMEPIKEELATFIARIGNDTQYVNVLGEFFAYFTGTFDLLNRQILKDYFSENIHEEVLANTDCIFMCDITQASKETVFLTKLINAVSQNTDSGISTASDTCNLFQLKQDFVNAMQERIPQGNVLFVLYASNAGGETRRGELNLTFDRSEIEILLHDLCNKLLDIKIHAGAIIGVHGTYKGYKSTTSTKIAIPPVSQKCWVEYCEKEELNFVERVIAAVPESTLSNESIRGLLVISKLLDSTPRDVSSSQTEYWVKEFIEAFLMSKFHVRAVKFLTHHFLIDCKKPEYFFLLIALAHCNDGLTKSSLVYIAEQMGYQASINIDEFLKAIRLLLVQTPNQNTLEEQQYNAFEYELAEPIRQATIRFGYVYFEDQRYSERFHRALITEDNRHVRFITKQEVHFLIAKRSLLLRQATEKSCGNHAPIHSAAHDQALLRYELVGLQNLLLALPIEYSAQHTKVNYCSLAQLYDKLAYSHFNKFSAGDLVNMAWQIFYIQVDGQGINPYTDQYDPSASRCKSQLKGEMLKLFFSSGQSFISRHFFLPQLLIKSLDSFSVLHLYNTAGMYYWYANDFDNIRRLYQSYRVFFDFVQQQAPSEVIGRLLQNRTLSFYARRSVSRVGVLHLLELSESGQLQRVRKLAKWYIEDLSALGVECIKAAVSMNVTNHTSDAKEICPYFNREQLAKAALMVNTSLVANALIKVIQKVIYYYSEIAVHSMKMGNFEAALRYLIKISMIHTAPLEHLIQNVKYAERNDTSLILSLDLKPVSDLIRTKTEVLITDKALVNITYAMAYFASYQASVNSETRQDPGKVMHTFEVYGNTKVPVEELLKKESKIHNGQPVQDRKGFEQFIKKTLDKVAVLLVDQKNHLDSISVTTPSNRSSHTHAALIKSEELWHLYNLFSSFANIGTHGLSALLPVKLTNVPRNIGEIVKHPWNDTHKQLSDLGLFRDSKHFRLLNKLMRYRQHIIKLKHMNITKTTWETETRKHWEDDKYWLERLTNELEHKEQQMTLVEFLILKFWHVILLTQTSANFTKSAENPFNELLQEQDKLAKKLTDLINHIDYRFRLQDLQNLLEAGGLSRESTGLDRKEDGEEIKNNAKRIETLLNTSPISII